MYAPAAPATMPPSASGTVRPKRALNREYALVCKTQATTPAVTTANPTFTAISLTSYLPPRASEERR